MESLQLKGKIKGKLQNQNVLMILYIPKSSKYGKGKENWKPRWAMGKL